MCWKLFRRDGILWTLWSMGYLTMDCSLKSIGLHLQWFGLYVALTLQRVMGASSLALSQHSSQYHFDLYHSREEACWKVWFGLDLGRARVLQKGIMAAGLQKSVFPWEFGGLRRWQHMGPNSSEVIEHTEIPALRVRFRFHYCQDQPFPTVRRPNWKGAKSVLECSGIFFKAISWTRVNPFVQTGKDSTVPNSGTFFIAPWPTDGWMRSSQHIRR